MTKYSKKITKKGIDFKWDKDKSGDYNLKVSGPILNNQHQFKPIVAQGIVSFYNHVKSTEGKNYFKNHKLNKEYTLVDPSGIHVILEGERVPELEKRALEPLVKEGKLSRGDVAEAVGETAFETGTFHLWRYGGRALKGLGKLIKSLLD